MISAIGQNVGQSIGQGAGQSMGQGMGICQGAGQGMGIGKGMGKGMGQSIDMGQGAGQGMSINQGIGKGAGIGQSIDMGQKIGQAMGQGAGLVARARTMSFCGRELRFGERTLIMGILNLTPDSFSDGGDYYSEDRAVERAKEMLSEGADIIDIGGESSRPGHTRITAGEELRRVLPVVRRLARETGAVLSLDTIRAEVADEAIKNGVCMINDIWGFQGDREMAAVAARHGVPAILMHNRDDTEYRAGLIEEIKGFLRESARIARETGVRDDRIILDPGLGFGKTPEQNMLVMGRLGEIRALGYPVLLGASRKSMLGKILGVPPKDRDEGTVATTVLGIAQGIDIARVHNVLANARAAKVADAIVRRQGGHSQQSQQGE